ncbi:MAG: hypothetical protein OER22_01885 [Gammaproteobacteria bacterium]|nr:hypothetical protein [Gammaproteobacteria bacterium]MDH3372453.1 hypothetical protein [Gammaproteobacteria bacterium]MDH3407888.1 hypothetical protein [Gammaproteobacteria bacterium]MDH3551343.1 hypothetical protein [Gammaproteobacteria bacterium]
MNFATIGRTTLLLTALILTACGGGGNTSSNNVPGPTVTCNPNDSATFDECGTVLIGFTDADGDFLNYTVDVLSLTLETADGRTVEVMPNQTRTNFTDYVDLTELVSAAVVPPATYVAGTISLDYDNAEVYVEVDGAAKEAVVTDLTGARLAQTDLKIVLSNRDQLTVTKRRAHLLQLDFDLAASHDVDVVPTPATAASAQFIAAEVHPVDEKDIRVRGPLLAVSEDEMSYTIAIRPFHDRASDFGRFKIYVTNDTEFEVDGAMWVGVDGLRALNAAGQGTPTIARGTLNVTERKFTADLVLAGSSVPGNDRDAVVGNIIKRQGNFLTVRGATIIPRALSVGRPVHFHDDVVVEVGPNTKVFKDGYRQSDLSIEALSIGQRVTIRGNQPTPTTDALAPQILFDATQGAVRMHVTHLSGIVNTVMTGQTDITLHSIDRRRVGIFDFSGTGPTPLDDADPNDYEIRTHSLSLADFSTGKPIVAWGFPTAFGMAPPDFTGRTLIDYTDVRSALGVGWGAAGTMAAFTSMGTNGLILNNQNRDIDQRHYIKQGPVLIDLTSLDTDTAIVPRETGRMLFSIKSQDSLRLYSHWDDFVGDLINSYTGATTARSMYAYGKYDVDTNVFIAYKLGVYLLEP